MNDETLVVWTECGHGFTPLHEEYGGHLVLRPECSGGRRLVLTRPDYEWDWCGLHKSHPMVSWDPAGDPYCWEGYWRGEADKCLTVTPIRMLFAAGDLWRLGEEE